MSALNRKTSIEEAVCWRPQCRCRGVALFTFPTDALLSHLDAEAGVRDTNIEQPNCPRCRILRLICQPHTAPTIKPLPFAGYRLRRAFHNNCFIQPTAQSLDEDKILPSISLTNSDM
jgi:hypothetical protein